MFQYNTATCTDFTQLDAKEITHTYTHNQIRAKQHYMRTEQLKSYYIDEFFLIAAFLYVIAWITQKLHLVKVF